MDDGTKSTLDELKRVHGEIKPFGIKGGQLLAVVRRVNAEERRLFLERTAEGQNGAAVMYRLALGCMVYPTSEEDRTAVLKRGATVREKLAEAAYELAEGGSMRLGRAEIDNELVVGFDATGEEWLAYRLRNDAIVAIRPWSAVEQARYHDRIGKRGQAARNRAQAQAMDELARAVVIYPDSASATRIFDEYPALADTIAIDTRELGDGGLEDLGEL